MVDLIENQSSRIGHKTLYTFLSDAENAEATLTYAQLSEHAKTIGRRLKACQDRGTRGPGERETCASELVTHTELVE